MHEHVVAVHAHPDDETLTMGGMLAGLIARGAAVTVVTLTRGELGEVIPAELAALEGSAELAHHRTAELTVALTALGVADHRFLGEGVARAPGLPPRRYLDSGMQWGEGRVAEPLDPVAPDSLAAAPLDEIVQDLAAVLRSVDATAVVSYDESGGYGHPDHVRAAAASASAAALVGVPYFAVLPPAAAPRPDDVVVELDDDAFDRKRSALLAHRTQVEVDGDRARLSSGPWFEIDRIERFRPVPIERVGGPVPAIEEEAPTLASRAVSGVASVAVGAIVAAITTVAHQSTVAIAGVDVPIGLLAGLVAVGGLLLGLRLVMHDRFVPFCVAMGLLGAIGLLSLRSTGGSVLVPANTAGIVWTFGPALVALLVVAWPRVRPLPARPALPVAPRPAGAEAGSGEDRDGVEGPALPVR